MAMQIWKDLGNYLVEEAHVRSIEEYKLFLSLNRIYLNGLCLDLNKTGYTIQDGDSIVICGQGGYASINKIIYKKPNTMLQKIINQLKAIQCFFQRHLEIPLIIIIILLILFTCN